MSFDFAVVFPEDGQADAQAQTSAAAGALGREKGVEDPRQYLMGNAGAIILERGQHVVTGAADADAEHALVANLSDRLLRIDDQIEKDLSELASVSQDQRKVR